MKLNLKKLKVLPIFLVIIFFINLPFINALQISDVNAESITSNSALIKWSTDEEADSFVSYGTSKDNLKNKGDNTLVTEHSFLLRNLDSETNYFFQVQSNNIVDNNSNIFYNFNTLTIDTVAPSLIVNELPQIIAGTELIINGVTEQGAMVRTFANNVQRANIRADENGNFEVKVNLFGGEMNEIIVESEDHSGNIITDSYQVFSDINKPQLELEELSELSTERLVNLKGIVSEEVDIEIFVNERKVKSFSGKIIDEQISLEEGNNIIKITLVDEAGWKTIKELDIESDTQPPHVVFDLTKGIEYYEGNAKTDITGETEPNSEVYLYIYRSRLEEYHADFKKAILKTVADENGNFKFVDVNFPPPPFSSLEELMPKEVPSGLQEVLISDLSNLEFEQRKTYQIYVVAEDKTGKTGYDKKVVHVNTCYSANSDFLIEPIPKFQAPFRLDPQLMGDGRESIQSVFKLEYRGNAIGTIDQTSGEVENVRILNANFQKACTQGMVDSGDYKYGCQLLPGGRLISKPNQDHTLFYVTQNLVPAADFIEGDKNFDDFVDKRQLKFPLKIQINYQEKEADGTWSDTKIQTQCYDLGYFVDVPIESSDLIPDVLANEGVDALNEAIEQIENIKPYLEKAMFVTGVGCMSSWLLRTGTQIYRFMMSNYEFLSKIKNDDGQVCPKPSEQNKMILQDTYEQWVKEGVQFSDEISIIDPVCPQTAQAWKVETLLDQTYKWTCDRFLCRSVPARWTEKATKKQVEDVKIKETQCTATSNCVSLVPQENCQDIYQKNPQLTEWLNAKKSLLGSTFTCYLNQLDGKYYVPNKEGGCNSEQFCPMEKMQPFPGTIGDVATERNIFAFKKEGEDNYCVGVEETCNQMCNSKPGYEPVEDGFKISASYQVSNGGSCYLVNEEQDGKLIGQSGVDIRGTKYSAGYTKDCFLGKDSGTDKLTQYQCVCQEKPKQEGQTNNEKVRVAEFKEGSEPEPWIYRQDKLFRDSRGNNKECTGGNAGTCYPAWQYFAGRDFSGAFGMNYAFDNIKGFSGDYNPTEMTTTRVDPHNQEIGTFQSVCLTGINARLQMLESVLVGLRDCVVQAKQSGLQDAGLCKSLFTQHVCGLIYKVISYSLSDCSPVSFKDVGKGYENNELSAFFEAGSTAIPSAIDSSINDIKSDYGNANVENFFATGAQGFSESMCLFAMGYDFPLGMDFIMDTAYSYPMETNVIFPLAERELSTFDPIKGTAVHNYNLGGVVLPGCKIQSYRTELKCIGPEDLGNEGIDCSEQKCDCLNVQGDSQQFAGERTYLVEGGNGFNMQKGQMIDLPIKSPQKVSSQYRYDHVVLSLTLDPTEDVENCFEPAHRTANGGKFYFPIQDVSSPGVASCEVNVVSGKFVCPELSSLFSGGKSYFEFPYIQCYDQKNNEYVNCNTPNLYIKDDPVAIKVYANVGDEPVCLKITDNSGQVNLIQPLPKGLGSYHPKLNIATVDDNLLSGNSVSTIIKDNRESDLSCVDNLNIKSRPDVKENIPDNQKIIFKYEDKGNGYELEVGSNGINVISNGYEIVGNKLTKNGNTFLTLDEINDAVFEVVGFKFNKILINSVDDKGKCVFRTIRTSSGTENNVGNLRLTAELLQPGAGESCITATTRVKKSNLGLNIVQKSIRIQSELVEVASAVNIHNDFIKGNYPLVIQKAQAIINRQEGTLDDAIAIYYWTASLIMQKKDRSNNNLDLGIQSMLNLFFDRDSSNGKSNSYSTDVIDNSVFKKIKTYMCEIDNDYGNVHEIQCKVE